MGTAMSDSLRFIGRLVAKPKLVGAIAPSSRALANAIAAQIAVPANGAILEIGPGTGVATQALIERGVRPEQITAIEFDPEFARLIAKRFPRVRLIRGDAFDLDRMLGDHEPFAGIISGLPLLNHSLERRRRFLQGLLARLKPGAPLIQFSYGLHAPVAAPPGVSVVLAALVLFNLPPARVWVYRQT
jgi:phosphatidylethanolamine/phosphatidyl-N-methylethanolamine N-methyltransferase